MAQCRVDLSGFAVKKDPLFLTFPKPVQSLVLKCVQRDGEAVPSSLGRCNLCPAVWPNSSHVGTTPGKSLDARPLSTMLLKSFQDPGRVI